MRKISTIAVIGMLALALGSCGGESAPSASTSPSPGASASPKASASPGAAPSPGATPSPGASPAAAQPFANKPLVAEQPQAVPAVPNLVQGTNPDERVKQTSKGRKDPFALLPIQPTVKVSPGSTTQNNPAPKSNPAPNNRPAGLPSLPKPKTVNLPAPSRNQPPSLPAKVPSAPTVATKPSSVASPTFKPELPKIPEPELARNVAVTGVVQVGGVTQAIVKAPDEAQPRYVRVGQRLSNGQVLVKRIEMGADVPVVVFEQYGIEVSKRVGETPITPGNKPGARTAMLPGMSLAEASN